MKHFRILFVLFFLAAAWSAQAQCVSGDCMNGTGIYQFPSGAKYIGQFKNGKMEGIGSCYYTDGSKYQGEWVESYPEGNGIKTLADGSVQKGNFKKGQYQVPPPPPPATSPELADQPADQPAAVPVKEEKQQTGCISGNCRDGKGIYIYPSGAIYIGEFKNGEIHGIGACSYSDGSKYQGEWVFRYPEGRGTKTFPDGAKWTGRWKKGQPVDDDGNIIENIYPGKQLAADDVQIQSGCVSGDCVNGTGIFAYTDGSKYEGTFREGKPHGKGTFVEIDGDKYVGEFSNGMRYGNGTLYLANGSEMSGVWRAGEYIGKPLASNGCVQGDCANGRGTYVNKDDGSRYTGTFKNGKPDGEGVLTLANSDKYTGQFANGKFNGKGTLIRLDGAQVTGYWLDGNYLGETPPDPEIEEAPAETKRLPSLKVWAVVVGVAAYNHMPTLRYTDDDAYRMYAFLKSPEGGGLPDEQIRVLIDEDATRDKILDAMNETFAQAGKNDLIILYYSGHGLKGAFLPIDFDGFNNRLEHEEINRILNESEAKYKLCIADACHSGSLLAMKSGEVTNVLQNYYTSLGQAQAGTALIMSSKSEETSLESSGLRQGVFSHFLIRGLKGEADADHDKVVTIQELFDFVNLSVRKYSGNRQSPLIQGDYDAAMPASVVRY